MKSKDPLHGVTLEMVLTRLVAQYGWAELGRRVPIRCFNFDPSISSSLKFLRRTPWARARVEDLYRQSLPDQTPNPPTSPHAS
ncbi:MAG TPA: VF530 family protein [Lacunisphaera sp.]|nr:VF530 family protein [Lacunisphaera sp.]